MAKSGGRRTYVRDNRGRFASTPGGGGSPKRPATKPVKRGPNRLTRDNAGRITSVGGDGATVRGGRLKTAAGNLRGKQVAKLKTMQGVSYGKGASEATKIHPRISNRSAADQTHRDKTAKQWKSVEKSARRAVASARATIGGPDRIPAYPRLTNARKIKGESRFLREQIYEQSSRLMRSPLRGKNKLTIKDRAGIVSDMVSAARSLKARSAMITPRIETLKTRAPRTPNTIAKPKGLKAKPASKSSPLASAAATLRQSLSKAKTRSDEAKARIAYKTVVRRELKNNPQNVLATNAPKQKRLPNQDSRMSSSKVRTVGNSKEQVQKRVERKLYQAERALDRTLQTRSRGLLVKDSIYQKQLKTSLTLGQASRFMKTGEMPKGDNSIAEKRKMADARERLIQKNKQRARGRNARKRKP